MKQGFILGLTTGLIVASASFVLANSQIQAILNNQIKVTLNGQVQEFRDETTNEIQYPITYKDRTYLPLRTVANLVGVDVDYDADSNTAMLTSKIQDKFDTSTDDTTVLLKDQNGQEVIAHCQYKSQEIEPGYNVILASPENIWVTYDRNIKSGTIEVRNKANQQVYIGDRKFSGSSNGIFSSIRFEPGEEYTIFLRDVIDENDIKIENFSYSFKTLGQYNYNNLINENLTIDAKLSKDGKNIKCTSSRKLNPTESLAVHLSIENSSGNNMGMTYTGNVYSNFNDVIIDTTENSLTISVEKLILLFQKTTDSKYSINDYIGKELQITTSVKYGKNNEEYYRACESTIILPNTLISIDKIQLIGEWKAKCYIREGKEYPYTGLGIPQDWGITINDNYTYSDNTLNRTGKVEFENDQMTLVSDYKGVKDLKIMEIQEDTMSLDYNIDGVTLILEKTK